MLLQFESQSKNTYLYCFHGKAHVNRHRPATYRCLVIAVELHHFLGFFSCFQFNHSLQEHKQTYQLKPKPENCMRTVISKTESTLCGSIVKNIWTEDTITIKKTNHCCFGFGCFSYCMINWYQLQCVMGIDSKKLRLTLFFTFAKNFFFFCSSFLFLAHNALTIANIILCF